jgi:hypothetical protein
MVIKIPHEIVVLLNIPDPTKYSVHYFRWTSATRAVDAGATMQQLVNFYS